MSSREDIKEVLIIIIVGVFLYFFFSFGLKALLNTDVPLAVVESGSMAPTLNVGDIIIVKGISSSSLKIGDIIVYQKSKSNSVIVHRIVSIIKSGDTMLIRTKGDNNSIEDPWYVTPQEVKGIVIYKIPYLGYIPLVFQTYPLLYLALFLLLAITLILPFSKKK